MPWYWQFLDVEILRGDLLRGVYYQHSQPPLFNLFLGFGLKLGGDASAVWFQTSFLALGLALTLALHALMRRLGVAPLPALLATVFFAVSPSAILYENSLFYTYPIAVIMGLAALAFARFASRGRTIDAALLFSLLAAAALTRSIFHLAWLLLAVGFVVLVHPGSRRRLVGIALLPVLLASAVYAKNWVHFGSFSASSWVGMSLAKLTTSTVLGAIAR